MPKGIYKRKPHSKETIRKMREVKLGSKNPMYGKWDNLKGQKFNRLVVLNRTGEDKWGASLWKCRCICGKQIITRGNHLKTGKVQSCGCLNRELIIRRFRKKKGQAAFSSLYAVYKRTAKQRNLQFALSKTEFKIFIKDTCYYCGSKPTQIKKAIYGNLVYNGIDRLNNEIGYIKSNCVSCCKTCNWMKKKTNVNNFLEHINKIYNYKIINPKTSVQDT